jgi:hypothetical protein
MSILWNYYKCTQKGIDFSTYDELESDLKEKNVLFYNILCTKIIPVLRIYMRIYNSSDRKDLWWNKIKKLALKLNMPPGDIAMIIRATITKRDKSPDLYEVLRVMSHDTSKRIHKRFKHSTREAMYEKKLLESWECCKK